MNGPAHREITHHRDITRSLYVSAVRGRVQLCQSALMPGDEYFSSGLILRPGIARSLAAALAEMADLADAETVAPDAEAVAS